MSGQRWCDGCLGSGRCWVCGGDGAVDRRIGTVDCPSCATTGICRYCAIPAQPEPQRTLRRQVPTTAPATAWPPG